MNVGFIGIGSMGSLLIDAFIGSGALKPSANYSQQPHLRKSRKLSRLGIPAYWLSRSNREAAVSRDIVFLCVKPHEYKTVINEHSPIVQPNQLIVSITSPGHAGSA